MNAEFLQKRLKSVLIDRIACFLDKHKNQIERRIFAEFKLVLNQGTRTLCCWLSFPGKTPRILPDKLNMGLDRYLLTNILAEKLVLAVKKQDSNNIVGLLEK